MPSQISYAKVAQSEEGGTISEQSNESPSWMPLVKRPAIWIGALILALGIGVLLTNGSHNAVLAEEALDEPTSALRGISPSNNVEPKILYSASETSMLDAALQENAELRQRIAHLESSKTPLAGVDDASFSALFEENNRLRAALAEKSSSTTNQVSFDIGSYRAQALAATPPNIIECAQAGEGGSQEACHLPRNKRYEALDQKGITLWMTGLSGSGKSTIARALEEELVLKYGKHVQQLDGDNVRTGLNRDLGFSQADRAESVRRVGEMACLFNNGGTITLVTLVSPYRADRDEARKRHEDQGLKFLEVFLDVPLNVVQDRDPKGLYAKVAAGEIKGFTGVDAPYEPPLSPEVSLPNQQMTVDECVAVLMDALRRQGVLSGGPADASGLPLPPGFTGNWLEEELILTGSMVNQRRQEALRLTGRARLNDIDLNWLHVISEGWAAPIRGFLREGPLLQALHFNSLVVDPFNVSGARDLIYTGTDWNDYETRGRTRTSLSVPIVLPITKHTKDIIEAGQNKGEDAVALYDKDGRILGLLKNPEIYVNRKEEIVTRCFGAIDPGHPYIAHIYSGGDWLLGGEIEIFERITYNDGLDQWRLSPKQLYAQFISKKADVVFAFQTRNPTHAGHAYLMRTGRERLLAKGYKNPILWLSPLGGWTKSDDVPLDVRVKQHQAILDEKMLDPDWTVMGIWPAPMVYAGPTEVQFHALSRRAAGASYFVVGRDAAGIKSSQVAVWNPDDDMYDANHARYVLQMSPVLEDLEMKLLSFDKFFYDKSDHQMKAMDPSRPDDFISISGSKMRALARQGAVPCTDPIPSDLLAANCVPQGFMVPSGWAIVCDYYQHIDEAGRYIPWSKPVVQPLYDASQTMPHGQYGTNDFALFFTHQGRQVSPWHDIPLEDTTTSSSYRRTFNFVTEIPMYTSAKMEVAKDRWFNPIMQDTLKNGEPRYYLYGVPFFNYGMLPQTWEDPQIKDALGFGGDDDPLDLVEIGDDPLPMGSITSIVVLGSIELIDEGETDHKILAIRSTDPRASYSYESYTDIEKHFPGKIALLVDWMKRYKTAEGKGENELANNDEPVSATQALAIIDECHQRWQALVSGQAKASPEFWLGSLH